MQPTSPTLKNVRYLFTDIDDTISTEGKITQQAYDALWRADDAGLVIVPVTGRPAGWCDHIARMWPDGKQSCPAKQSEFIKRRNR